MSDALAGFKTVLGSDVRRNGRYLELIDLESGDEVAEVFFADEEEKMSISVYKPDMPVDVIEAFVAKAKLDLPIP
jgi:hypothetical protein